MWARNQRVTHEWCLIIKILRAYRRVFPSDFPQRSVAWNSWQSGHVGLRELIYHSLVHWSGILDRQTDKICHSLSSGKGDSSWLVMRWGFITDSIHIHRDYHTSHNNSSTVPTHTCPSERCCTRTSSGEPNSHWRTADPQLDGSTASPTLQLECSHHHHQYCGCLCSSYDRLLVGLSSHKIKQKSTPNKTTWTFCPCHGYLLVLPSLLVILVLVTSSVWPVRVHQLVYIHCACIWV